jgi:putative tricarboxylic transport membrane protein
MFPKLTLARTEVLVAVAFVLASVFIMFEGVRLGPGWGDSGPQAGFFPFSLATLILLGAIAIVIEWTVQMRRGVGGERFFEDREEVTELFRVGIPIAIAIATVPILGLYLMTASYLFLFGMWHGRFRWYGALAGAIIIPAVMYLVLDWGLRIPMPRSIWFSPGFPI